MSTTQLNKFTKEPSMPIKLRTPSPRGSVKSMDHKSNLVKSMENLISPPLVKRENTTKSKGGKMRRSLTLKDVSEFKRMKTVISVERIKAAKEKVEEAVKKGKIFTIIGPYHRVREIMRSRGWVEKFYYNLDTITMNYSNAGPNSRRSRSNSKTVNEKSGYNYDHDDSGDDDFDGDVDDLDGDGPAPSLSPWDEDDGIYGIMSRMLKNNPPNLFWTLRKTQLDFRMLKRDQIVNHHGRSGYFTTKTGLAKSLDQLRWFDDKEPDHFFPRCFVISNLEEKDAFIDNFRLTACMSMLKCVLLAQESEECNGEASPTLDEACPVDEKDHTDNNSTPRTNRRILPKIKYQENKRNTDKYIDYKFLEMAIEFCEYHLKIINHEDIDKKEFLFSYNCDWEDFLSNYYKVVHEGYKITRSNDLAVVKACEEMCRRLKSRFPQFDMEGFRNVWILKPGAKSRGRGIMCYNRLADMLKLVSNSIIIHDTRFIVQKYIERPLLVYNTKFDIRQWFMVTDWNPLTIWWYKDAYLRFCSQQFTLDDFNESVHLSNNSIQNKYLNGPRSNMLPNDNMWFWEQFTDWLKNQGHGNVANTKIMPAMKEAVIDTLLCVQDMVEWRKNTFEVYGADFMISDNDLKPWLIEINSSPCMSPSTSVTAKLTHNILEDTFKVILDRRDNKSASTGRFELIYRQLAISIPPYIGIDLKLNGTTIRNPFTQNVRDSTTLSDRRVGVRPLIPDSFVTRQFRESGLNSISSSSSTTTLIKNQKHQSPDISQNSQKSSYNGKLNVTDIKIAPNQRRSTLSVTTRNKIKPVDQKLVERRPSNSPSSKEIIKIDEEKLLKPTSKPKEFLLSASLIDSITHGPLAELEGERKELIDENVKDMVKQEVEYNIDNMDEVGDRISHLKINEDMLVESKEEKEATIEDENTSSSILIRNDSTMIKGPDIKSTVVSINSLEVLSPSSPTLTNVATNRTKQSTSRVHQLSTYNPSQNNRNDNSREINPKMIVRNRQYKLPTKVEVVNFSMANNLINQSGKSIAYCNNRNNLLQRKALKRHSLQKSTNSQIVIQRHVNSKSATPLHEGYMKTKQNSTFSSPSHFILNQLNRSRTAINPRTQFNLTNRLKVIHSATSMKNNTNRKLLTNSKLVMQCHKSNMSNNSNVILVKFVPPV